MIREQTFGPRRSEICRSVANRAVTAAQGPTALVTSGMRMMGSAFAMTTKAVPFYYSTCIKTKVDKDGRGLEWLVSRATISNPSVVVHVQAAMNRTNMAMLFLSMIVLGATAHRLLEATSQKTGDLQEAEEHQRILAELEEVHTLRERMLQQGKCFCAWA